MANLQEVLTSWKSSAVLACAFAVLSVINALQGSAFYAIFYGLAAILWVVSAQSQRRRRRR